ncbi:MAG: fibronectin [Actinobacteria bacterium]|nr:fibronectin [Actinomycetota bacterium]MSX48437.1 fibronectin [Actinomycetota bacterium]MSX61866.1 fibronectin [Actinomycetota bacterium]MSY09283.1 fibronectin [Actinomycetota bacterium]MTA67067.1 fibronectin [Actinomycetota bacterium]
MLSRLRTPLRSAIALTAILAGLFYAPPAGALSLTREAPSTVWGHTYAGPATTKTFSATTNSGTRSTAKSRFIVTYNNFPEWAKTEVQAAIDVWSLNFASEIPITVDASWGRSAIYGVLGSARPGNYFLDFPNSPDGTLWYPSALANALAGEDLDKNSPEIVIQVNSATNWNQRNDGKPSTTEYDLQSVFVHELGHGLGFLSTDSYDTNSNYSTYKFGIIDQPTAYDAYAQLPDGRRLSDIPSPSLELGEALTNTLVWSGPLGIKANGGVKPLLYTPPRYSDGSSVSHLDEATFSSSGPNSVMTPNLDAGEIFHDPGPLLVGMMEDLRNKPPAGVAIGLPDAPRNASALVADRAAVVTFNPPVNVRSAQVSRYEVKNMQTGLTLSTTSSPAFVSGLKNGTSYTFSVTAINSLGQSIPALTGSVVPQVTPVPKSLDNASDARYIAVASFRKQPAIAYTDKTTGALRLQLWNGKTWRRVTVDGRGGAGGKTSHSVAGPVSLCISGLGTKQVMHIFYSDLIDKDLRYATFDSVNFKYEVVDGNGDQVNLYDQPERVRTASDVSVSNACAITASGIQVFYRDESQGILLGAKRSAAGGWDYELVDGDRKTDGRTTGDVAFHLRALAVGSKVSVIYDSNLAVNQQKQATNGEIRFATRSNASPSGWSYQTLDTSSADMAVVGYGVSLNKTSAGLIASWLGASTISIPNPIQIRWMNIDTDTRINSVTPDSYGAPTMPMSIDGKTMIFGCQTRICSLELNSSALKPTMKLVSGVRNNARVDTSWVVLNKVRYLVAGISGKLALVKI